MRQNDVKKELDKTPEKIKLRSQLEDSNFICSEKISYLFSRFDDSSSIALNTEFRTKDSKRKNELKAIDDFLKETEKSAKDYAVLLVQKKKYSQAKDLLEIINKYFNPVRTVSYEDIQAKANKQIKKKRRYQCVIAILAILCLSFVSVLSIMGYRYHKATSLFNQGEYYDAHEAFTELGKYKDSDLMADEAFAEYEREEIKTADVGDCVFFGRYEQDNISSNGKERIRWIILDRQDNKCLLISEFAIDCQQYNAKYADGIWKNSTLRQWLNETFKDTAFSTSEQKMVLDTIHYKDMSGADISDKVFLLSIDEANKYFESDEDRECKATNYAHAQGTNIFTDGNCWWLLRSIGEQSNWASGVSCNGYISSDFYVSNSSSGVRPAIWIGLEANTSVSN